MTQDKRLEIRKQIHKAGMGLYDSFPDGNFKWLVGDLMAKNEDYVLANPETYGADDVLAHGFTDNQRTFIEGLRNEITDKGWDRQLKVEEQLSKLKAEVNWLKEQLARFEAPTCDMCGKETTNLRSNLKDALKEIANLKQSRNKLAETMIYQIKFPAHMFCKFVKDENGVHRANGTDDKVEAIKSWIKWSEKT